ncbi:hypothetical protein SVIOM74S_02210 [Streptomyces violarus]
MTILCPYNLNRLDADVLADAYATHPTVVHAGTGTTAQRISDAYNPDGVVARYNEPLPVADALTFTFDANAADARHTVRAEAERLGLTGIRLGDLALVTAELTADSVVHGGGTGTVRVWAQDRYVVCEVRDKGRLARPLAGRRPAAGPARRERRTAAGEPRRRPGAAAQRGRGRDRALLVSTL